MKKFGFSLLIVLLASAAYAQSPWIQPAHNLYAQISFNVIPEYDLIYLRDGAERLLERNYSDITVQGWLEYGFSPNTTLILSIPYKILKAGDLTPGLNSLPVTQSGSLTAPGNIEFGIRQSLLTRHILLSAQIFLEFKTSHYDKSTGLRSGYDAAGIAPIISIGYGREKFYGFLYSGTGFRSNNYSSSIRGGFEGGYQIFSQIWIAGFLDMTRSLRDGSYTSSVNNFSTAFYINDQEYVAWGLKAIMNLSQNKYGLVATFAGAFSGNNVAKSPSINLGFFYKYHPR